MLFKIYLNGIHSFNIVLWPGEGDNLPAYLMKMAFLGQTVHVYDNHCKMWYQWVQTAPEPILIKVTDEDKLNEYLKDMAERECCKTYHDWSYCPTHTSAFEGMERGEISIEGVLGFIGFVLIIVLACYWFGVNIFHVAVNFSDIISGIF